MWKRVLSTISMVLLTWSVTFAHPIPYETCSQNGMTLYAKEPTVIATPLEWSRTSEVGYSKVCSPFQRMRVDGTVLHVGYSVTCHGSPKELGLFEQPVHMLSHKPTIPLALKKGMYGIYEAKVTHPFLSSYTVCIKSPLSKSVQFLKAETTTNQIANKVASVQVKNATMVVAKKRTVLKNLQKQLDQAQNNPAVTSEQLIALVTKVQTAHESLTTAERVLVTKKTISATMAPTTIAPTTVATKESTPKTVLAVVPMNVLTNTATVESKKILKTKAVALQSNLKGLNASIVLLKQKLRLAKQGTNQTKIAALKKRLDQSKNKLHMVVTQLKQIQRLRKQQKTMSLLKKRIASMTKNATVTPDQLKKVRTALTAIKKDISKTVSMVTQPEMLVKIDRTKKKIDALKAKLIALEKDSSVPATQIEQVKTKLAAAVTLLNQTKTDLKVHHQKVTVVQQANAKVMEWKQKLVELKADPKTTKEQVEVIQSKVEDAKKALTVVQSVIKVTPTSSIMVQNAQAKVEALKKKLITILMTKGMDTGKQLQAIKDELNSATTVLAQTKRYPSIRIKSVKKVHSAIAKVRQLEKSLKKASLTPQQKKVIQMNLIKAKAVVYQQTQRVAQELSRTMKEKPLLANIDAGKTRLMVLKKQLKHLRKIKAPKSVLRDLHHQITTVKTMITVAKTSLDLKRARILKTKVALKQSTMMVQDAQKKVNDLKKKLNVSKNDPKVTKKQIIVWMKALHLAQTKLTILKKKLVKVETTAKLNHMNVTRVLQQSGKNSKNRIGHKNRRAKVYPTKPLDPNELRRSRSPILTPDSDPKEHLERVKHQARVHARHADAWNKMTDKQKKEYVKKLPSPKPTSMKKVDKFIDRIRVLPKERQIKFYQSLVTYYDGQIKNANGATLAALQLQRKTAMDHLQLIQ